MLKEFVVALGPDTASWISQDYKSRVPIGLPAANKQDVVLMHLEYRVRLPDHDWVVASRHKLIPSVYVYCKIEDDKVSYSEPTYIAIRSGKHSKSSAAGHSADFNKLLDIDGFQENMKMETVFLKPV